MSAGVVLVLAIAGLVVGSAVWVVARNQATRRSLRSNPVCAACDARCPLTAWLPLAGFGTARRCGACQAPPSRLRIVFELIVAAFYGAAAWRIDDGRRLAAALVFAVPLLVILLVDAWTRLIHTNVIRVGIVAGLAFGSLDGLRQLLSSLGAMVVAAVVFGGLFVLARVIYRSVKVVPFGLGDVYLAAMIGAMVRLDEILRALVYGVFLAGVIGVALLVTKRAGRRQAIPYGPYLCLGALLVLLS